MASSAPTALVVGMGTQMGYGLASTFAHAGYFVHLVSRTQSTLEAFASSLEEVEGSGGAGWTALDAHDVDGLQQAIVELGDERGAIDVVIWNAADPDDRGFA